MNMRNKQKSTSNQSTNKSVNRTPVSLILASVATIAISWVGMAAYMDYRLQQMEHSLSDQSEAISMSVSDSMDGQLKHFGAVINKNVNENSAVIAKGILDLSKQEEERFNKSLDELASFGSKVDSTHERVSQAVNQVLKEGQLQISQLLVSTIEDGSNDLKNLIERSLLSQNEKTDEMMIGIESIRQDTQDGNDQLVASIKDLNQQLDNTQNQLTQGFTHTAKSLESLASTGGETIENLASQVEQVSNTWQLGQKKVSAELTELLNRVQTVLSEMSTANRSLSNISGVIPELQRSNQEQMELLTQSGSQEQLTAQMENVYQRVHELSQKVDETSQNLLKAMYITNDGLDETSVAIKSEVAVTQEKTARQLESLTTIIQELNQAVDTIVNNSPNVLEIDSSHPTVDSPASQAIHQQMQIVFDQITGLQSRLEQKMKFAQNAVEQQIEYGAEQDHAEFLTGMAKSFVDLTNELNGYFETIAEKLNSVKTTITTPTSVVEYDLDETHLDEQDLSGKTKSTQNVYHPVTISTE